MSIVHVKTEQELLEALENPLNDHIKLSDGVFNVREKGLDCVLLEGSGNTTLKLIGERTDSTQYSKSGEMALVFNTDCIYFSNVTLAADEPTEFFCISKENFDETISRWSNVNFDQHNLLIVQGDVEFAEAMDELDDMHSSDLIELERMQHVINLC